MLVFLIEIVGAEGVGGGGKWGMDRRKEILNGREAGEIGRGGGVTQKCIMIAMEKGFKEQTQDNERREPDMQDTGAGGFPSCSPPPTKESGLPEILIFTELCL